MTSSPIPNAKARFFNRDGTGPLAGGKLYTYVAGSVNTPKTTYKDYNNNASNTNPIILDAAGEADIWLDGNYKLDLYDSLDVAQWAAPIDNVSSINSGNTSYTTTGSSNAYILTPSPAITSYTNSFFTIKASFGNTGPATININGLGAVALTKSGSTALASGDIVSGNMYNIAFDGTGFQILNLAGSFTAISGTTLTISGATTLAVVGTGYVKAIAGALQSSSTSIPITDLAAQAANTIVTNATAGSAAPTAVAINTSSLVGRAAAGNIGNITLGAGLSFSGSTIVSSSPFSKSFTSAVQTITSAGTLTLAHGLGGVPKFVTTTLINTSAEGGYSVNDRVAVYNCNDNATNNLGASIVPDATNLNIKFSAAAQTYNIVNKSTGARFDIDNTKWKVEFFAAF